MSHEIPEAFAPGRVQTLRPGVRRITAPNAGMMTGPGTNTYLLGEGDITVIDPGVDDPAHLEAIQTAAQGRISRILVTHNHPDHSTGARELAQASGAPVLAHPRPLQGVRNKHFKADAYLDEGDVLDIESRRLRVLHTPGHSADHLGFVLEDEGLLFAGDHVMEAVTVVILPPDGDMDDYLQSMERLQAEPIRDVAPGHGGHMPDAQQVFADIIRHRLAREQQILDVMDTAGWRIADLVERIYVDAPRAVHPVACQQVLAHLQRLARQSRVSGEGIDGLWQRS